MEFKIASKDNIGQYSDIAIKNRLYVAGWTLRHSLKYCEENDLIVLAFDDSKPIAVAHQNTKPGKCSFFVRKEFRRMGIGTELVNIIKKTSQKEVYSVWGMHGSEDFFKKCDLEMRY